MLSYLSTADALNLKFGDRYFIFGDSTGQVYRTAGTAVSDNGKPINCVLEGFIHMDRPDMDKIFKKVKAFANPGCQASLYLAATDHFDAKVLNWMSVGSLHNGVIEVESDLRGKFLYFRVLESSTTTPFVFYGFHVDADLIGD
jgi:hypothetical protein